MWVKTAEPERARLGCVLAGMFDSALETAARHDPADARPCGGDARSRTESGSARVARRGSREDPWGSA